MVQALEAPDAVPCASCGSPSKMQCPKCKDLGIPKVVSAFCSQDCFKGAWGEHKMQHKPISSAFMYILDNGKSRCLNMPPYRWTGDLRPFRVSPTRSIPDTIAMPDWATTGFPAEEVRSSQQKSVVAHSAKDIAGFKAACELGRKILDAAHRAIKPGVTSDELDRVVHECTIAHGAYPSPRHYYHFPKSVCISVNEVVCHGIPDMRELVEGDIVNVDVSCMLNGYHGDLNETFTVGEVDAKSKKLVKVAYECLMRAVAAVKPGMRFRDLGEIISGHARAHGFSVNKSYCGHGICDLFHCRPNIPHYAPNKAKGLMEVGNTFTIEPMINAGAAQDVTWPDGWTAVTADGKRSAQFEHGLVVTPGGCEVLTARTAESPPLWWEVEGVALDL